MSWLNRDSVIAAGLLVLCGALMMATFEIREPDYGQLSPATWPRVVVAILSLLSLIYLIQSIRMPPAVDTEAADNAVDQRRRAGFFGYWKNVIWCFALFLAYLISLPYVGMLMGGTLFVFFLLNMLGGWTGRRVLLHAAIAIVTVGGMWSLFTYGLGVMLPTGELFYRF